MVAKLNFVPMDQSVEHFLPREWCRKAGQCRVYAYLLKRHLVSKVPPLEQLKPRPGNTQHDLHPNINVLETRYYYWRGYGCSCNVQRGW